MMKTETYHISIGDTSQLVQPGALAKLEVRPQQTFQLRGLSLSQYPVGGWLRCVEVRR